MSESHTLTDLIFSLYYNIRKMDPAWDDKTFVPDCTVVHVFVSLFVFVYPGI